MNKKNEDEITILLHSIADVNNTLRDSDDDTTMLDLYIKRSNLLNILYQAVAQQRKAG